MSFVAASSLEVSSVKLPGDSVPDSGQGDQNSCLPKETVARENGGVGRVKKQQYSSKCDSGGNSSTIHPVRTLEEENLDYDSNASSSSFEFHKERSLQNSVSRSLSRPMPSKWNDAEKWIMNRQNAQANYAKKNMLQIQSQGRLAGANMVRVAPELASNDHKLSVKRVDFCQSAAQLGLEKFSFVPNGIQPISAQAYGGNALVDLCQTKDLKEVNPRETSSSKCSPEDDTGKLYPHCASIDCLLIIVRLFTCL